MKMYSYRPIARIGILIYQTSGVLLILVTVACAIFLLWHIRVIAVPLNASLLENPRVSLVCLAIWCIMIGFYVGMFFINYLPKIWINEQGVTISAYIFFRIFIPWAEIIDIKPALRFYRPCLVRARRISLFHRIYGWMYSHSFYPSFIISRDLIDRDELINEIRLRIHQQS
jgi:hypothetical protein